MLINVDAKILNKNFSKSNPKTKNNTSPRGFIVVMQSWFNILNLTNVIYHVNYQHRKKKTQPYNPLNRG